MEDHEVRYTPGESDSGFFGGNSNWRGPVWFPLNYLLIEALERYHHFYGDGLTVEVPAGSGRRLNLRDAAHDLAGRLATIFLPDANGRRPCHGNDPRYARDPHWRDLVLFHEYFHGDDGPGAPSTCIVAYLRLFEYYPWRERHSQLQGEPVPVAGQSHPAADPGDPAPG